LKKNLMIFVPLITIGGLEKVAVTTAEFLKDKYNVSIVVFNRYEHEFKTDIPVYSLDFNQPSNPVSYVLNTIKNVFSYRKICRQLDIDITLAFNETATVIAALGKAREKVIGSFHGFGIVPKGKIKTGVYHFLYKRIKSICVSKVLSAECAKAVRLPLEYFPTVYNPFDIDEIEKMAQEDFAVEGSPKLLFCGRLDKFKNIELVMEALSLLIYRYPDARLYILGDGDHKNSLYETAGKLGISDNVIFTGRMLCPFPLMSKCDIMLNPSYNEGFGNTLVEALICKVPVISVDCKAGPREILAPDTDIEKVTDDIEFAEYGILLAPSYPDDDADVRREKAERMAKAVDTLLSNKDMQEHYRRNGAKRLEALTKEKYIQTLTNLIES